MPHPLGQDTARVDTTLVIAVYIDAGIIMGLDATPAPDHAAGATRAVLQRLASSPVNVVASARSASSRISACDTTPARPRSP